MNMQFAPVRFTTEEALRADSTCFTHIFQFERKTNKVLIKLVPAEGVVQLNSSSTAASLREKRQIRPQGVKSSVLVDHDLPDDEVAALGFSQAGLQLQRGVLPFLLLAVLIT